MNKKKEFTESKHLSREKKWSERIKNSPASLRTIALLGLLGISVASYSLGKLDNQTATESSVTDTSYSVGNNKAPVSRNVNNKRKEQTFKFPYTDWAENAGIIKREDDKWKFSSDGGKTWTEDLPEGVEVDKEDNLTCYSKDRKKVSEFNLKENRWRYSEDGGKTWSDPIKDIDDWLENGLDIEGGVSMKFQDGKVLYSTDGGKTWSEEVPEEFQGDVKSVITKTEDGKTLYSIDGGKTWSEDLPEGYEIPDVDKLLDSIMDEFFPSSEDDLDGDLGDAQSTSV